jgi:hypothetical protein
MIEVPDDVAAVLAGGSFVYSLRVESWLDGELLAEDVPVVTGSEEVDRSLAVPERVTLTVPRERDGFDWTPHDLTPAHPLAANGQRLRVLLGVGVGNGVTEWFQRGEFLIYESAADGPTVSVTAVGLLYLISEARLVSPYQPSGTLVSTLRGLVEPALTITVDGALTNRSVPSGVNYDEDRLGAVGELLDAWPAQARVVSDGYLLVEPVTTPTVPVLVLTSDGDTATVVTVTGSSTRDGAASVVVARGTAADGGQLQGVAYDLSTGPHAYGGPFNALPVPQYFYSPLMTTVAQCTAAARTILRRLSQRTQNVRTVTCVPRPDLEPGDAVEVDGVLCTVEGMTLPYTAAGGAMTITAREV